MKVYTIFSKFSKDDLRKVYAVTNSKNKLKEFMKYRNQNVFTVSEGDISKEAYKYMEDEYAANILHDVAYQHGKDMITVMSNKMECDKIESAREDLRVSIDDNIFIPYDIFNIDIQKILDGLMYTFHYYTSVGSTDWIYDNLSYGFSPVFGIYIGDADVSEFNLLLAIMRGDTSCMWT